jgi:hypothetical protein
MQRMSQFHNAPAKRPLSVTVLRAVGCGPRTGSHCGQVLKMEATNMMVVAGIVLVNCLAGLSLGACLLAVLLWRPRRLQE